MGILIAIVSGLSLLMILLTKHTVLGILTFVSSMLLYYTLFATYSLTYVTILIIGLVLVVIEFYMPSFGIVGFIGLTLSLLGFYLSNISLSTIAWQFGISLLVTIGSLLILMKRGHSLQLTTGVVLKAYQQEDPTQHYHKQIGVTMTSLRPIGKARFGKEVFWVQTSGKMIGQYERIIVYKVDKGVIYVREDILTSKKF